ncbi:MAG: 4Fe-4S dicluster domain-containing protein [Desulfobacterales bacterium]
MDQQLCTGCGTFIFVCPHEVLYMKNGRAEIADRDECMECGACAVNCPAGALIVQAGVGCAPAVINSALGRKRGRRLLRCRNNPPRADPPSGLAAVNLPPRFRIS